MCGNRWGKKCVGMVGGVEVFGGSVTVGNGVLMNIYEMCVVDGGA